MVEEHVLVVVEIPTGSRNKYELDSEIDAIVLDRMVFTATRYPADYGYIECTLGEDGDPLDSLYKDLEGKQTSIQGFGNREAARDVIDEARRRAT
jgi:inorganic pyrophosphatase